MACALCDSCPFDGRPLPADALPHEIHVTVRAADVPRFRDTCAYLGVKPVLLALQLQQSDFMDLMTSFSFMGTSEAALAEAARQANGLRAAGFEVLRQKIESAPWHPWAPTRTNAQAMPEGAYFESHVAVVTPFGQRGRLTHLAQLYSAHISRNAFKRFVDTEVIMLTFVTTPGRSKTSTTSETFSFPDSNWQATPWTRSSPSSPGMTPNRTTTLLG